MFVLVGLTGMASDAIVYRRSDFDVLIRSTERRCTGILLGSAGILLVYVTLIKGLRLKLGTLRGYVLIFLKTASLYRRAEDVF